MEYFAYVKYFVVLPLLLYVVPIYSLDHCESTTIIQAKKNMTTFYLQKLVRGIRCFAFDGNFLMQFSENGQVLTRTPLRDMKSKLSQIYEDLRPVVVAKDKGLGVQECIYHGAFMPHDEIACFLGITREHEPFKYLSSTESIIQKCENDFKEEVIDKCTIIKQSIKSFFLSFCNSSDNNKEEQHARDEEARYVRLQKLCAEYFNDKILFLVPSQNFTFFEKFNDSLLYKNWEENWIDKVPFSNLIFSLIPFENDIKVIPLEDFIRRAIVNF